MSKNQSQNDQDQRKPGQQTQHPGQGHEGQQGGQHRPGQQQDPGHGKPGQQR